MAGTHGSIPSTLVALLCFGLAPAVHAERAASPATLEQHSLFQGSAPRGSVRGVVRDESGAPIAGARVSLLGLTGAAATTDRAGQFVMPALPAGSYLLRVRVSGYLSPRARFVSVRDSATTVPAIVLRDATAYPVLAAGFGPVEAPTEATRSDPQGADAASPAPRSDERDKTSEAGWRMRHLRRGVLRETNFGSGLAAGVAGDSGRVVPATLLRAADVPVRAAVGLFSDVPWSGQVNLMTAGSFDDSYRRASDMNNAGAGVAYLRIGSPVGGRADWNVQGALTSADVSSWVLSGAYAVRAPARHQYDLGVSYSTQQYNGGNRLALRDITDGSRNVGTIRGFDRVALAPGVSLSYGARYERYDYLEGGNLVSPKIGLEVAPVWARFRAELSSRALAPGAEEFLPPADAGLLLPPQRTFSSVGYGRPLQAERANQAALTVERDMGGATFAVRGFRQRVSDQLATWFDATVPGQPEGTLGHYLLANVGTVYATGWAASVRTAAMHRLAGMLEYSSTRVRLTSEEGRPWWAAESNGTASVDGDRVQNLAAAVEATVPESATRVMLTYRASTGLPTPPSPATGLVTRGSVDTRFDVQIRQSLPFLDSRTGRWEMLFLVRNFFREAGADQGVFDEMFVVRPPKRVIGGLSLYF